MFSTLSQVVFVISTIGWLTFLSTNQNNKIFAGEAWSLSKGGDKTRALFTKIVQAIKNWRYLML
jgi:hypothetical protein